MRAMILVLCCLSTALTLVRGQSELYRNPREKVERKLQLCYELTVRLTPGCVKGDGS